MKKLLSVLVFALLAFICISCDKRDSNNSGNSIVEFNDAVFKYDGEAKSIECELPEGYTVDYLGCNGVSSPGKHPVVAVVYDADGNKVEEIKRHIYIVGFNDVTVAYDGEAKEIEVEALPDFCDVNYIGNGVSSAGSHTVTAVLTNKNTQEEVARFTAKLNIVDLSSVVFESKTLTYTGSELSIECENVPDGVLVTYDGNGQIEVGTYEVTAVFYDGDFNPLGSLSAVLTIVEGNGGNQGGDQGGDQGGNGDETITSDYVLKIGEASYNLVLFEEGTATAPTQYSCTASVTAGDKVVVLYQGTPVTNIGDEREGSAGSYNNVYGSNDNMVIVATAADAVFYFKVYADGHSIYATGNSDLYPGSGSGSGSTATTKFQLVVNGVDYYDLYENGVANVDGVNHDEYKALGITLNAGDVITLFDSENNVSWAITNVNPYSSGSPVGSSSGITMGESGLYDIYVQFLYGNDKIYFGPAQ